MPVPKTISEEDYHVGLHRITMAVIQRVKALLKAKAWTQRDLANALQKAPSEISKYLSGEHNLTLKTIAKLEAALEQPLLFVPQTTPVHIDRKHLSQQLYDYFAKQAVTEAYLFGSVARDEADADSDIDLYLVFPPDYKLTLLELARMHNELEEITQREVDLVVAGSEFASVGKEIEKDKIKVYS
jgi:predicted nucleotidyltransferase/DNA-binding Xre family transcriptional regulator